MEEIRACMLVTWKDGTVYSSEHILYKELVHNFATFTRIQFKAYAGGEVKMGVQKMYILYDI